MIIVATFTVFALAMSGMALGVMLGRRPLAGACGAAERCCRVGESGAREAERCLGGDERRGSGGPDFPSHASGSAIRGCAGRSDNRARALGTGVSR